MSGILAGLVSITAGCSVMDVELAFVTGIIGGVIYFSSAQVRHTSTSSDITMINSRDERRELKFDALYALDSMALQSEGSKITATSRCTKRKFNIV